MSYPSDYPKCVADITRLIKSMGLQGKLVREVQKGGGCRWVSTHYCGESFPRCPGAFQHITFHELKEWRADILEKAGWTERTVKCLLRELAIFAHVEDESKDGWTWVEMDDEEKDAREAILAAVSLHHLTQKSPNEFRLTASGRKLGKANFHLMD